MGFAELVDLFLYFLFLSIYFFYLFIEVGFDLFWGTRILRFNLLLVQLFIKLSNLALDFLKLPIFLTDRRLYFLELLIQ